MIDPVPIIDAIRSVTGPGVLELHKPRLESSDIAAVNDCLMNDPCGHSYVDRFERTLERLCSVRHALAVVNGTSALELALRVVGVQADDEVICPALTFVATANAICHVGAIPVFADAHSHLGISPYKLAVMLDRDYRRVGQNSFSRASGRRLGAIVMVHLLGIPAEAARMRAIADDLGVPLVEDAAEALGSMEIGSMCGSVGTVGVLSFNANKIVTTGGGGALLTNDPALAAYARHLATTAKRPHAWEWWHDEVAWNFRMPNVNAAMGMGQLNRLVVNIQAKRALIRAYGDALAGTGMSMIGERYEWRWNSWLAAAFVPPEESENTHHLLAALHADGIKARAIFTPLHQLPMFEKNPRDDLTYAEHLAKRMICLPSGIDIAERI